MNEETNEPFRGYDLMCAIVGKRYAKCWFDNYEIGDDDETANRNEANKTAKQYALDLKDNPKSGKNLILMGESGTGKDHLAVAVVRAALSYRMHVKYLRGSVLSTLCREHCISHSSDVPHDILNCGLLVISDIEPNPYKISDFEERALLTLIDYRYAQMLPIVVTTNLIGFDAMAGLFGYRTISRLFHDAVLIPMTWDDYRRQS